MFFLKNLDSKVEYDGYKLVSTKENKDVRRPFNKYTEFGDNKDLGDNLMQLGWNEVGHFQVCEGGFCLKELENDKESKLKGKIFSQVTTRSVNSCTFVHIAMGNDHVVAHLDDNKLVWGLETIKGLINGRKNEAICFCSHVFGTKENDFYNNIKEECGGNCTELLRHRGDITAWARMDDDEQFERQQENLYGHLEIGLGIKNNNVVLFGDITEINSPGDTPETFKKTVPSWRFESVEELMDIKNNIIH